MDNHYIINADKLTLGYKNDDAIINEASFKIAPNDFVFITGASGSGKSTILRSLFGHLKVRDGSLTISLKNKHGEPVPLSMKEARKSQINALRRQIGIVFQDYKLINEWSVEKNIALPMKINEFPPSVCAEQVKRLLHHIKLEHKASRLPLELSGGEQQRVAMARAISSNPQIILADEPTGNLDDYSSELIWNLLKGVNEQLNITIVVVTHRIPTTPAIAHKRLHIEKGGVYEFN